MSHKKKTYTGFSDTFDYCEICDTRDFSLACKTKNDEKPQGIESEAALIYKANYANYSMEFLKDVLKSKRATRGSGFAVPMMLPFSTLSSTAPNVCTFHLRPAPSRILPNLFTGFTGLYLSLADWIPEHAPVLGDNFLGIDRSIDVTTLAGLRYTSHDSIEENIATAAALLNRENEIATNAYLNPDDFQSLLSDLGRNLKETVLTMNTPYGSLVVKPDCDCPQDYMYVMDLDAWTYDVNINQLYTTRPRATCVVKLW